uniref:Uncharacterized protein n=1 Tax=Manihot esculenta TaxID=3983 RepID=A0A2C9UVG2_MANES
MYSGDLYERLSYLQSFPPTFPPISDALKAVQVFVFAKVRRIISLTPHDMDRRGRYDAIFHYYGINTMLYFADSYRIV